MTDETTPSTKPATKPAAKHPARKMPPLATRFGKGKSGNPKGRPKGARNLARLLKEALDERIVDDGQEISKLEAAVKKIATNAAAGDPRILQMLLAELRRLEPSRASEKPHDCMDAVRVQMEGHTRGYWPSSQSSGRKWAGMSARPRPRVSVRIAGRREPKPEKTKVS